MVTKGVLYPFVFTIRFAFGKSALHSDGEIVFFSV